MIYDHHDVMTDDIVSGTTQKFVDVMIDKFVDEITVRVLLMGWLRKVCKELSINTAPFSHSIFC